MTYLQAIILGLVQGLAEFLPISSSGHLALLQYFFGVEAESVLMFTVLMHVGTLVSVFIIYRKDIAELIVELGRTIKDIFTGKGLRINSSPTRRLGFMIIVASIPTAVIGLLFEDFFGSLYSSVVSISVGLIITGIILFVAEKLNKDNCYCPRGFPFGLNTLWRPCGRSGESFCGKIRISYFHSVNSRVCYSGGSRRLRRGS